MENLESWESYVEKTLKYHAGPPIGGQCDRSKGLEGWCRKHFVMNDGVVRFCVVKPESQILNFLLQWTYHSNVQRAGTSGNSTSKGCRCMCYTWFSTFWRCDARILRELSNHHHYDQRGDITKIDITSVVWIMNKELLPQHYTSNLISLTSVMVRYHS